MGEEVDDERENGTNMHPNTSKESLVIKQREREIFGEKIHLNPTASSL